MMQLLEDSRAAISDLTEQIKTLKKENEELKERLNHTDTSKEDEMAEQLLERYKAK